MSVDFGTDLSFFPDLDPGFGVVSGADCLGQALARRLETPRGGLWYDADYGTDIRDRLNDAATQAGWHALQSDIEGECEKDERVRHASATVTLDTASSTLTVSISCDTADGPFVFVLSADALSVQFLETT